jgi:hypothetical protein
MILDFYNIYNIFTDFIDADFTDCESVSEKKMLLFARQVLQRPGLLCGMKPEKDSYPKNILCS